MLHVPNLHTLIMPAVADINLLYTISVLANQLKVLDLSFSLSVDDDAISNTIGKFCEGNLNHITQFRDVGGFTIFTKLVWDKINTSSIHFQITYADNLSMFILREQISLKMR